MKNNKNCKNVLLIDVGNSSTCLSLGNDEGISAMTRISTAGSNQRSVRRIIQLSSRNKLISGSILCSVVPEVNSLWISEIYKITGKKPLVVNHRLNLGVKMNYPAPESLGADRLANISGAVAAYGYPVLVADFGTASTFNIVNSKGLFVGGVIAPGICLMTDYMADRTALLPRIKINAHIHKIGRNTSQAMRIGALIGYKGLVREITEYLIKQNGLGRIKLVATGGFAKTVVKNLDLPFCIDQELTLRGIYRIFQLNN